MRDMSKENYSEAGFKKYDTVRFNRSLMDWSEGTEVFVHGDPRDRDEWPYVTEVEIRTYEGSSCDSIVEVDHLDYVSSPVLTELELVERDVKDATEDRDSLVRAKESGIEKIEKARVGLLETKKQLLKAETHLAQARNHMREVG